MSKHRSAAPRAVMGSPWWIRLALYVIVAAVGLVLTVLGYVDQATVDGWLGQVGSLAALIGGLFAAAHTGRASDQPTTVIAAPAPEPEPTAPALPVYTGDTSAGE